MTNFEVTHRNSKKHLISYFIQALNLADAIEVALKDAKEWNEKQGVAFDQMASEIVVGGLVRKVHG